MKTRRWMTNLSVLYFRRNLLPPGESCKYTSISSRAAAHCDNIGKKMNFCSNIT